MKLAEDDAHRYREERLTTQRESFEKSALLERERQEVLRREKILEIKYGEMEGRLKEAELKLKFYRGRELTEAEI